MYPAGRYWEMVQRLKPTHFYGAPTALRLLLKHGDKWVKKSVTGTPRPDLTRPDLQPVLSVRLSGCQVLLVLSPGEPEDTDFWSDPPSPCLMPCRCRP